MASKVSRIFNLQTIQRNRSLVNQWGNNSRNLFTLQALGIDMYEKQRVRVATQFAGMSDRFREKMKEYTESDKGQMIFTEDLKNMAHIVEKKPEDLMLVLKMMQRFNSQNKSLRFGNFVFGPVIMRMYHHLNDPVQALIAFKDPELNGLFDQFTSYQILCDLLYRNKMYQEVFEVFDIVKEKNITGIKYPRNVTVLLFASCYKLNTPESFEKAMALLNEMKEHGTEPIRKAITYVAQLALNQNSPQVALEVLSLIVAANYVTIRNLKISALADLNRADDALPILRYSIEMDTPAPDGQRRNTVCPDVLEKLQGAIEKMGKKETTLEFDRIHKAMIETQKISDKKLTEILDEEIQAMNNNNMNQRGDRQSVLEKSFRYSNTMDLRPRRNPAYPIRRDNASLYE